MSSLIEAIEAFCAEHDMAESQFGVLSLNDKNIVPDLRGGRDVRMSTVEKIRSFIETYRPEQASAA